MRLDFLTERAIWSRRTRDDRRALRAAPRSAHAAMPPRERAHDETPTWRNLLDRYLAGWAEANPFEIIHATAPGYRFHDPLVGLFTRWSLPLYFELMQARFCPIGATTQDDLAFVLRGPIDPASSRFGLRFWRESPRIGLAGIAEIDVGERGVIAETVTYSDPPADVLRGGQAVSP